MKTSFPTLALAAASLLCGTAALATAKPAHAATTQKHTVVETRTMAKPGAKPMVATTAHTTMTKRTPVRTATGTHMVTTKTRTGRTVTYNCAKAGNANKTACKKG